MSSTDVESLQPASRQRSRCLDAFLLGSVITLFVMVLSGAALGFWVVKDLRADMETWTKHVPRAPERRTSPEGSPNVGTSFKVCQGTRFQNQGFLFVYWSDTHYTNSGDLTWCCWCMRTTRRSINKQSDPAVG